MKILMVNTNLNTVKPGGDSVQLLATQKALEELGVEVHARRDFPPTDEKFDLVHVFNIQKGTVFQTVREMLKVKRTGTPMALSTIYWNPNALRLKDFVNSPKQRHRSIRRRVRDLAEHTLNASIIPSSEIESVHQKYIYDHLFLEYTAFGVAMADVLLPNGREELLQLAGDIGIPTEKLHAHIVPNAVPEEWLNVKPDPEGFKRKTGLNEFILCVGRVSPVKNQHTLIMAMKGTGVPIVLIGEDSGDYADYCRKLSTEDGSQVKFMGPMQQGDLVNAYAAAKVHVLPSWRETPGLASLEAGLMGCNLVVTPLGTTREYFGEDAWYCQPDDPESIREAVAAALQSAPRTLLRQRIVANFTWKEAARMTLEAYQCVLSNSVPDRHVRIPESLVVG